MVNRYEPFYVLTMCTNSISYHLHHDGYAVVLVCLYVSRIDFDDVFWVDDPWDKEMA